MKHDVMKALAAARPEQLDPSADPAVARARRERDLGRAFQSNPGDGPADGRARGRRTARWGVIGAGVLAAGAATAVAVAAVGPGAPASPDGPAATVDLGKGAVLAAAKQAETQPTGAYWYTDVVQGQAYVMRAPTGDYAITGAHDESFSWYGAKPGTGESYFARDLPARPQTARDVELWRKAGSPTSFRVPSDGRHVTYTTKAAEWRSDGPEVGHDADGGGSFLGGKSVEELQSLPTAPGKLAEMFLGDKQVGEAMGAPDSGGNPAKPADPAAVAGTKIMRVSSILGTAPVPPKVRAGLMRALADQPGVRAIGKVTDPLGRPGVALAAGERAVKVTDGPADQRGTYTSRTVIVFDERTGALLSRMDQLTAPGGRYAGMKPGFVIEHSTVRSSGWTDSKPAPPAELPY